MLRRVTEDEGLGAAAARRVEVVEARRYLCGGMELGFSWRCCGGGRGLRHGPGSSKLTVRRPVCCNRGILFNGPYTKQSNPAYAM